MTVSEAPQLRALAHLHPERRRPALAAGAAMLALAGCALAFPRATSLLVGVAGGWLLWLAGALMLGFSIVMFTGRLRLAGVAAAVAAIGAGAYLTFNPSAGALATAFLLAAALAVDGSFQLAAALHLRPLGVWRWMLASSAASLVVAALLAFGVPARTPDAVAVLLAVAFGSTGMALIGLNFARLASRP